MKELMVSFLQVDNGVLLGKALQMHDAWLEENDVKSKRFVVATWSDWDCRIMLDSECLYKGLHKPLYFNRFLLPLMYSMVDGALVYSAWNSLSSLG